MKFISVIKNILKGLLLWFTAFITIVYLSSIGWILDSENFLLLVTLFAELIVFYFICYVLLDGDDLKKYSGYNLFNKLLHFKDDLGEED